MFAAPALAAHKKADEMAGAILFHDAGAPLSRSSWRRHTKSACTAEYSKK